MNVVILKEECKKMLSSPVILGFVIVSILLNSILVLAGYDHYRPQEIPEAVNIFKDFNTDEMAENYINKYHISNKNAAYVRRKYEKLQPIIDEKAINGDALSPYFGQQTNHRHQMLFDELFLAMIAESGILAIFLALYSITYENMQQTEGIVCTATIGRSIRKIKLSASLFITFLFTAIILAVSLSVFFLRFDFSAVWNDNVSSMFHTASYEYGKPFITWRSFTVLEYLWATVGVTFGLTFCLCLLGYGIGLSVRNGYLAFLVTLSLLAGTFLLKLLFPIGSLIRGLLGLSPVWLWKNCGAWFTDGWADILFPCFELVGLLLSLICFTLIAYGAGQLFRKRDLL